MINLIITGNFEVAHEAFLLVENIEHIQDDNIKKAFVILNNLDTKIMENWRKTLIDELLEMFE